jgi:type III pantothenate kinase
MMDKAEFLLINNNNTRTKFSLAGCSGCDPGDIRSIASKEVGVSAIDELLTAWSWDKVVLASVVPKNVPDLIESQKGKDIVQVSTEIELGIDVDFPNPSSIGADRLANASAVAERAKDQQPIIVVDFGTAVTFDIVDKRPAYVGGIIAPGLDAMSNYLHSRTALLPLIDLKRPEFPIGKSTEQAMLSGAFYGYRGLVKEIIGQIEEQLQRKAKVIATGGYAELISNELPEIHSVEPSLTMDGLHKIARLNFSNE